jgi:hypothetical protein
VLVNDRELARFSRLLAACKSLRPAALDILHSKYFIYLKAANQILWRCVSILSATLSHWLF